MAVWNHAGGGERVVLSSREDRIEHLSRFG